MNAKGEFINHTSGRKILCAIIKCDKTYLEEEIKIITLPVEYSEDDYNKFLESLDFNYDDGYGGQELFGTIWYTDGTWSDRGEYDGSEWWEYNRCPEIPQELKQGAL